MCIPNSNDLVEGEAGGRVEGRGRGEGEEGQGEDGEGGGMGKRK